MPFALHGAGYRSQVLQAPDYSLWLYTEPDVTPFYGASYWGGWSGFDVRWAAFMDWMDDSLFAVWRLWQMELRDSNLSRSEQRTVLLHIIHRLIPEMRRREVEEVIDRMMETTSRIGADQFGHVNGFSSTTTTTTTTVTTATALQRQEVASIMQAAMQSKGASQQEINKVMTEIHSGEKDGFVIQHLEAAKNKPPAQQALPAPPAASGPQTMQYSQSSSMQTQTGGQPQQQFNQFGQQIPNQPQQQYGQPSQPQQYSQFQQSSTQMQSPQQMQPATSSNQSWSYTQQGNDMIPTGQGPPPDMRYLENTSDRGLWKKDGVQSGLLLSRSTGGNASQGMPYGMSTMGSTVVTTTTTTTEEIIESSQMSGGYQMGYQQMGMAGTQQMLQPMGQQAQIAPSQTDLSQGMAAMTVQDDKKKKKGSKSDKSSKKKGKEPVEQPKMIGQAPQLAVPAMQIGQSQYVPTDGPKDLSKGKKDKEKDKKKKRSWL